MIALPSARFDQVAAALKRYADGAALSVHAGEVLVARCDWAPGMRHTLVELRASAEMAGSIYRFFIDAAPHEHLVREFFATLPAATVQARWPA
jgi:hypothetical protein